LNRVLVAPMTRTIRGIPTEVHFDEADGMPAECVASFDNVRQIPRAYLGKQITTLSGPRMHEVCKALAIATACD